MKDRIAKSVFWMGWSKGVVQICAFLSTVLVARLLEPSDFGALLFKLSIVEEAAGGKE